MEMSIGSLFDALSICNLRIWKAEDIKRKLNATDKEIADACRITNIENQRRHDLIDEINKYFGGKGEQGTTKIYG